MNSKRIAVMGAGRSLTGALDGYRDKLIADLTARGYQVEAFHDELQMKHPDLEDLADALGIGRKAHENAERIIEEWRTSPTGRMFADFWHEKLTGAARWDVSTLDLSRIESHVIGVDLASGKDFSTYLEYCRRPGVDYLYRNWTPYRSRRPDRKPRGKVFMRMVALGYRWPGSL